MVAGCIVSVVQGSTNSTFQDSRWRPLSLLPIPHITAIFGNVIVPPERRPTVTVNEPSDVIESTCYLYFNSSFV